MSSRSCLSLVVTLLVSGATPQAQTPRPFPVPGQPRPEAPERVTPPSPVPGDQSPTGAEPSEASLGVPLYPLAQFLTSYDAGRGQRFYVFGVNAPYADLVSYYRNTLKQRGDELFQSPPTYQFEIGRFRDETMAFPPTVTIKDFTFGGSGGYPNLKLGGQPARYPTLVQIVPVPPGGER
ncbi:MAG: hypothetical protein ACT4QD_19005 [Acidobacteriota bacterium]